MKWQNGWMLHLVSFFSFLCQCIMCGVHLVLAGVYPLFLLQQQQRMSAMQEQQEQRQTQQRQARRGSSRTTASTSHTHQEGLHSPSSRVTPASLSQKARWAWHWESLRHLPPHMLSMKLFKSASTLKSNYYTREVPAQHQKCWRGQKMGGFLLYQFTN